MDNSWFKELVVYQIWCRSFKDGNGDGIGDLYGVLEELEYIKSLGVNCIWFSPLYPSPNCDYGYDVADYKDIHPDFGNLDVFKEVLDKAHSLGMKVIMDLVVNHTSTECEWFKESKKSVDNPYHDYYIWRKGKNGNPPNNWLSNFEGCAWEYVPECDEYYLHTFAIGQPDLNMDNPKVREEVKSILRFWLDMGVDGFREDVITYISKKEGLPNGFPLMPIARGMEHYNKGPHFMEYMQEFREVINEYDCFVVGESPMTGPADAIRFASGDDRILDMLISFDHMSADCLFIDMVHLPFSLKRMKKAFSKWQKYLYGKAWNALYIENHDHPRIISRYGNEKYRTESGKMLATMCFMQSGTPFIYQGQEIGMVNTKLHSYSEFKDVMTFNGRRLLRKIGVPDFLSIKLMNRTSRENSRTPVQWNSSNYAGFSTVEPWFGVNKNYKKINVAAEEKDKNSILNYYRKLFKVRQSNDIFIYGEYKEFYKQSKKIYCYERRLGDKRALIVCSFVSRPVEFKAPLGYKLKRSKIVLHTYKDKPKAKKNTITLRPYEAVVYLYD
ncbi:MAG: alpha-glucosidase [Oscillospiraceae bacterium]|nr:alpha-glucosidase [Oscillospiraceae bacterium]